MKLLSLLLLVTTLHAADPITLKLWPEGAPGKMQQHSKATEDFIRTKSGKSTITDISDPTIEVYRPAKPNGTSVIVAPGGGYVFLSAIHEGTQVCEWLNTIGVTGILLKYRTPTRDEAAPHEKPVADAAKAIALVREHAKEWSLDPNRVGLLGFSAGGNLLAHLACDRDWSGYPQNYENLTSRRLDFGIMIYGGGFVDSKEPTKFKEGFTVPADAPPLFIACAHDDGQNPIASTALYLEYKKHSIPCELHLFTKGGHGFGMRDNKQPINAWPQRCAEWMNSMGWLPDLAKLDTEIALKSQAAVKFFRRIPWICTDMLGDEVRGAKVAKDKLTEALKTNDSAIIEQAQATLKSREQMLREVEGLYNERHKADDQARKMIEELVKLQDLRKKLFPWSEMPKTP